MARFLLIFGAALAVMAANAAAAPAGDLLTEMNACRALGDGERLACFDRTLARQGAPAAVAPVSPAPQPKPASDFGSERLPASDAAPKQTDSIVAKVKAVSWNAFRHFTVTLDNGQVWRQLDSDTATAQFGASQAVKISRGFLDSYSLSVDGVWGTYKVKRIK